MKVLHIDCSPRVDSYSRKLSTAIISRLKAVDFNVKVMRRDLGQNQLPHIDSDYATLLSSVQAMTVERSSNIVKLSEELIQEVEEADVIVIGMPLNNFTVSSVFKSWIDHVLRVGRSIGTTSYGEKIGLLDDKPVFIGIASGGSFFGKGANQYDGITPYLSAVFECIGLKSIQIFPLQGTAFIEHDQLLQNIETLASSINLTSLSSV